MKREDCRGLGGRGPELALGMYCIARRVCVLSGVDLPQNSASICASSFQINLFLRRGSGQWKWTGVAGTPRRMHIQMARLQPIQSVSFNLRRKKIILGQI